MMNGKPLKILGDNQSDPPYVSRFGPIPGAILRGGDWVLPLVNVQDDELALIARSRTAQHIHTRFTVAFTSLTALRCVFLANTNLSIYGQLRLTGYHDVGRTDVAFGPFTTDAYPNVGFTETLEWEAANSWTLKPLARDLEGFTQNAWSLFDIDRRCLALDVEILDETNPDEFVQFGRLLCMGSGGLIQHYSQGGSLAFDTDTTFEKSMSGAEFPDPRQPYRVYNVDFRKIDSQLALNALNIIRRVGTHGNIVVIDDSDPQNLHTLSFLARPLKIPAWLRTSSTLADLEFQLKERLP